MKHRNRRPPFPFGLRQVLTDEFDMGVVYNPVARNHTVVIVGKGWDIAALDYPAQASALKALAGVVERAASGPVSTGTSWIFRRRPPKMTEVWEQSRRMFYPGLLRDDTGRYQLPAVSPFLPEVRRLLSQEALQLFDIESQTTADVTMAAVLTMEESSIFELRRRALLTVTDVRRDPLVKLATNMRDGLSNCGIDAEILDYNQLWAYVHDAWSLDAVTGDTELDPWPVREVRASHERLYTDSVEHAVLKLHGQPEIVWPHFFSELGSIPGWTARTLCGEMVSARKEDLFLSRAIPLRAALDDVLGRDYKTPGDLRRIAEAKDWHEQVAESRFTQHANALFCVSGREGTTEVVETLDLLRMTALGMGLKFKLIKGAAYQVPAFLSATTGINLL